MRVTVSTIIFGLPQGQRTVPLHLTLPTPTLCVSDLIACKVRQEVAECQAQTRSGLSGEYLAPETLITTENLDTLSPGPVDDEVTRALRAFAARDFMIVVDNQRLTDPQSTITLCRNSCIEFIKILPLVGG
jgi:hypothetical protein